MRNESNSRSNLFDQIFIELDKLSIDGTLLHREKTGKAGNHLYNNAKD